MSHTAEARPVGGPIWTRNFRILASIALIAGALILYRFMVGLGPVTDMTDGYPWGIWKLFNVIVLTSLASGGYAMALLVYVMNKGHYHPLVRHALLTSAVGYTMGVLALGIDVGRPWNFGKVLTYHWAWNIDSVLLEVALCITAYILVLWIELAPAFLERIGKDHQGRLGRVARSIAPRLDVVFVWVIGLGILLPTMHQSSLGSLFLLAGHKVHPFWQTPMLPLLFLLSCWIMGYAAVILTYILTNAKYRRQIEMPLLASLSRVVSWVILAFIVVRIGDLLYRGMLPEVLQGGSASWLLLLELSLFVWPLVLTRHQAQNPTRGALLRVAMVILVAGSMYRLDSTWIQYSPGDGWVYFPSTPELLITFGLIAVQVMLYSVIVKRFPILETTPLPRPSKKASLSGAGAVPQTENL